MCIEFNYKKFWITTITTAISWSLVILNYIIRTLCFIAINWIGYATYSDVLYRVTYITFFAQFFNTAFLLMLVYSDLSEQPVSLGFNRGGIPDFNMIFFRQVGNQLVQTMLFNALYPLIEFPIFWGLRELFRVFDRPCCSLDRFRTKKTSINSYISIYVGPVYYMHFKYSAFLNICFVTMMFGFGIPLLFPVATLGFAILYVVENLMLYYSYQQPPLYDEKLDTSVLNFLKFAPLGFLAFGYWMVSSKQLLANDVYPFEYSHETQKTGHLYNSPFTKEGWVQPAWPMLAMFFVLLLVVVLERFHVFYRILSF